MKDLTIGEDLSSTIKAARLSLLLEDAKYLTSLSNAVVMDKSLVFATKYVPKALRLLYGINFESWFFLVFEQVLQLNLDMSQRLSFSSLTLLGLRNQIEGLSSQIAH